ncbi:MAG: rRNA (guanosine-2-O-)-methyltransferase RlmB [Bacteroidota bacterium]
MQPLSKAKLRLFAALQLKKIRYEHGLYIAEGVKMCREALDSDYPVAAVVVRAGVTIPADLAVQPQLLYEASVEDFQQITTQVNPEGILTVLRIPEAPLFQASCPTDLLPGGPAFILAALQDPGNLGTIIRTSDWFGMPSLILGPGTVDPFNPKVTRSSMGSLFRTQLHLFSDLESWLTVHAELVWCADMEGEPIDQVDLSARPYVLLGNEALGVPPEIARIQGLHKVTIPRIGKAESLNAASAAAIFAWKLRHRS